MKKLSAMFIVLALLFSHAGCVVVALRYSEMLCGIAHRGFSAPAEIAFLTVIPFAVAIAVCAILASVFRKKAKET